VSSREQLILEEIKTRLNGSALGPLLRPVGLSAERSRLRELAPSQLPSLSIYPLSSDPERKGYLAEATLLVKIAIWVKGTSSIPVDADLDPIWLWVHQQLLADESLGGLSHKLEPSQKIWGFALHQAPFGDLDLHYLITYRHQAADPTRP
jgi:hypothetical protein